MDDFQLLALVIVFITEMLLVVNDFISYITVICIDFSILIKHLLLSCNQLLSRRFRLES